MALLSWLDEMELRDRAANEIRMKIINSVRDNRDLLDFFEDKEISDWYHNNLLKPIEKSTIDDFPYTVDSSSGKVHITEPFNISVDAEYAGYIFQSLEKSRDESNFWQQFVKGAYGIDYVRCNDGWVDRKNYIATFFTHENTPGYYTHGDYTLKKGDRFILGNCSDGGWICKVKNVVEEPSEYSKCWKYEYTTVKEVPSYKIVQEVLDTYRKFDEGFFTVERKEFPTRNIKSVKCYTYFKKGLELTFEDDTKKFIQITDPDIKYRALYTYQRLKFDTAFDSKCKSFLKRMSKEYGILY